MSTCPIFERQSNFKIINCRKTTGKQSIKRQRLWLNNLLIVIQSLHRKVKHPLSFFSRKSGKLRYIDFQYFIFIFKNCYPVSFAKFITRYEILKPHKFLCFPDKPSLKKIISLQAFYRLMNFGFFSSDVTRISGTVICSIDRLTQIRHITAFCVSNWTRPEDGWRLLNPTTETAIMRISIMVRSLLALFGQCIG